MKTVKLFSKRSIFLVVCFLFIFTPSLAATGINSFDLSWRSVDGGGRISQQEDYTLLGIIGQPDVGTMQGGRFALSGGFLISETNSLYQNKGKTLYLPILLKGSGD